MKLFDGMWSRTPFTQQRRRDPPGKHRLFKLSLNKLKASWPVLTFTDIHRYFPSLQWHRVIAQIARLAGLDGRDVDAALALHGKLWWYTDAVAVGMPAGCDLSHVLGTALLSIVDDQLMSLLDSDQAAVRWVDDYKFGVDSPDYADHVLDELARGSLADLQLALHPDKTKVVPSRRYVSLKMSGAGRVDDGDEEVEPIAAAELRRRLAAMPPMQSLGKEDSRSLLDGAEGDEAAMVLAEHAPQLLAGNYRKLPVRLRQLAGEPLPEEVTNLLLYSLAHGIEPSSPTDGEAAYVLSYLVHEPGAEIGASGRRHLKAISTNSRRTERTRATAAWTLASETDDFERTLLEHVGGMSPLAARGILAAAHRAGAMPRTEHWAAGAIAA